MEKKDTARSEERNAGKSRCDNSSTVAVITSNVPSKTADGISDGILDSCSAIQMSADNPVLLLTNQSGDYRDVLQNYVLILRHDRYLGGKVRHNALSGRPEVSNMYWQKESHPLRDNDLFNLRLFISNVYGISNEKNLREAISIVANEHTYHPIVQMLKSLKWDGTKRIGKLFPRYLGAEASEYTTAVTKLLLSGAIKRVLEPGVKYDICVVLADTQQGTGKSTICRMLALSDAWYTDAVQDLSNDKKAFEAMQGHWICELGEMIATRKAKLIEDIKGFITRLSEVYRTPYNIYPEEYPRQCIFVGTTNKPEFLPDDKTGNRRFVPLLCDGNKAEKHPLDDENETREFIRQCYAEMMELGEKEGFSLVLDRSFSAEINAMRETSSPEDTRIGMIQAWLDHYKGDKVCTRMIWDGLFSTGTNSPQRIELQDIADIMNLNVKGWKRYRGKSGEAVSNKFRFEKYGQQRAWIRTSEPADGSSSDTQKDGGFMSIPEGENLPFS